MSVLALVPNVVTFGGGEIKTTYHVCSVWSSNHQLRGLPVSHMVKKYQEILLMVV